MTISENTHGDRRAGDHSSSPTKKQIRRWQQYLANERAEGALYRSLALKKTGEERDILHALADAEERHEQYWKDRLGEHIGLPKKADLSTRLLSWMAEHFGSVFVLALLQSAESRSHYERDDDATDQMAADERIHAEVIRGLASRGRAQMSGSFRAAIFGINDGLVSNMALVLGIYGTGVDNSVVLVTGLAGLLAGALSMAAGEYVSVSSQRELLQASTPHPDSSAAVTALDDQANELALVYRARGMSEEKATEKAARVFRDLKEADIQPMSSTGASSLVSSHEIADANAEVEAVGSAHVAALSSFLCFTAGAAIPVLPFLFGFSGVVALVLASVLVGIALILTGGIVGLLSGVSPLRRALRQLAIGFGAAAVTYGLGLFFGVSTG